MMSEALVARIRYHIQKANFMGLKDAESTLLLGEAADAIEGLSKPRWIPVTERLPENGMRVLCACRANIFCVLKWDGIDWVENPTHVYMSGFVTHWMPLPSAPTDE